MSKLSLGRGLIIAVAVVSIVVPVGVDGLLYANAHMQNPLWLPHAKLHTAMSFHAAIALGAGSLALLAARWRRPERADLAITAFLATAVWAGLGLAGLWPGTASFFAQDPAFADMSRPVVLGLTIDPKAALAVVCVIVGWLGFVLAASGLKSTRPDTNQHRGAARVEAAKG